MVKKSVLELIGGTPVVKLERLFPDHQIYLKLEKQNPGGSIKDRIALAMVEAAEKNGELKPGGHIIEPTSGNTGVGLAMVAAVKGYKITLVMPESMSIERRRLMAAYGANLELTPREKGMKGAIEKANEMLHTEPNAWMPSQFTNPENPEIHTKTTAKEILEDFSEGLDYIITGVGTGGHITGLSQVLKKKFPTLRMIAVEPDLSPVLSGGEPGPHPIQGIGAGFVPEVYQPKLIDGVITVSQSEAFEYAQQLALKEGILAGISTGASLAAVAQKLKEISKESKILSLNYDTGERYFSVEGLY